MIGEDIKIVVTLEELRKVIWDYSEDDILGLYNGSVVRGFMFDVKECGEVDPLTVQSCNVSEGWVEHFEFVEPPRVDEDGVAHFSMPKFTPDFEPVKKKVKCKVVIDLLDATGNVIVTLRSE